MENGGGGEHRPWMYDAETTDIYRKFASEHQKLSPYLHTTGTNAIEQGVSSIIPVARLEKDVAVANEKLGFDYSGPLPYFEQPTTYSYQLGRDLLVHPVMFEAENRTTTTSIVHMEFPGDETTTWLDYWHPAVKKLSEVGGTKKIRSVALDTMAVYVRQNAFIATEPPVDMKEKFNYAFSWYAPKVADSAVADAREKCSSSSSVDADAATTTTTTTTTCGVQASASYTTATAMYLEVSAHASGAIVDVIDVPKPQSVSFSPMFLKSGCLHNYDPLSSTLHIQCSDASQGVKVEVNF